MLVESDYQTVLRALQWSLSTPGTVVEVRGKKVYKGLIFLGYFNDPEIAANSICQIDNDGIEAFYMTLNPVNPDCFERCSNRFMDAKGGDGTHDNEITHRTELLLDFDPKRVSGISSTDAEHDAAIALARHVADVLTLHGFPAAAIIDSGNGAHLRYKLDFMANDEAAKKLLQTLLNVLAKLYDTKEIKIDRKVFNASRICKIPGTVARKGEHTANRPHRLSQILRGFDPFDNLNVATIEKFINDNSDEPIKAERSKRDRSVIEYPEDEKLYYALNKLARERIHDWVPHMFAGIAREYAGGYRLSSADLGRDLEEDIAILPSGVIKDFGLHDLDDVTEGRRTPVSLVAEFKTEGNKTEAAEQLALMLNCPMDPFTGNPLAPPPLKLNGHAVTMPAELMGGSSIELAEPTRLSDIYHNEIYEPEHLIENLVAMNTHTVLSAPAKAGKSTLMYKVALHCAFGRPLFGREVQKCNVLYLALEEREKRFHRKMKMQIRALMADEWSDCTEEEVDEATGRILFFTMDSKKGGSKHIPIGLEGADDIRRRLNNDTVLPWVVVIEPVLLYHIENMATRNINKLEYEQISIINDIIQEDKYKCSVITVKHDRKSPAGSGGGGNIMDNIAGSVAQQGAPDAQIQFVGKNFYSFTEITWLMLQSRDFGKQQIPLISDGFSWITPPSDMEIPEFEEYLETLKQQLPSTGAKMKDPMLDAKIAIEVSKESGIGINDLSQRLNISYQIVMRGVKRLLEKGQIIGHKEIGKSGFLYKTPPAPDENPII